MQLNLLSHSQEAAWCSLICAFDGSYNVSERTVWQAYKSTSVNELFKYLVINNNNNNRLSEDECIVVKCASNVIVVGVFYIIKLHSMNVFQHDLWFEMLLSGS